MRSFTEKHLSTAVTDVYKHREKCPDTAGRTTLHEKYIA
jgi:hypothetical protein